MDDQLRKKALELYTPPFKFQHGYIFDAKGNMVSDNHDSNDNDSVQRVRGWGRIGALQNGAEIQDAVGEHIAKAMTEYWERQKEIEMRTIISKIKKEISKGNFFKSQCTRRSDILGSDLWTTKIELLEKQLEELECAE